MAARQLTELSAFSQQARNVHLFDDGGEILGGIFQNGSITQRNLFDMCEVFLRVRGEWTIFTANADGSTGRRVGRNRDTLGIGNYLVLRPNGNPVDVTLTDESVPRRVVTRMGSSGQRTRRTRYFHDTVRSRDHDCMISGRPNPLAGVGDYGGFHVAHIFPLAREPLWIRNGYRSWISDDTSWRYIGDSKIHSPQNGLLLNLLTHERFDSYAISVNPDDSYKVVSFLPDVDNLDGRRLDSRCLVAGNNRISDDCLRWHFRQAVLLKMKGVGERPWDTEPPDEETLEAYMDLPDGPALVEAELYNRLGAGDISSPEIESH